MFACTGSVPAVSAAAVVAVAVEVGFATLGLSFFLTANSSFRSDCSIWAFSLKYSTALPVVFLVFFSLNSSTPASFFLSLFGLS